MKTNGKSRFKLYQFFWGKKHLRKQMHVFLACIGMVLVNATRQLLKVISELNAFWYIKWSVGYFLTGRPVVGYVSENANFLDLSLSQWLNLNLADCSILDGLRNGIELVGKVVYGFVEGIQFCVGPFATSARRCLIFWALKRYNCKWDMTIVRITWLPFPKLQLPQSFPLI